MNSKRLRDESGNVMLAVLLGISALGTLFTLAQNQLASESPLETLRGELRTKALESNREALEIATALFRPGASGDGIAAIVPEPYVSETMRLSAPKGIGRTWKLEDDCVVIERQAEGGSKGSGLFQAVTRVCPESFTRASPYPYLLKEARVAATTTIAAARAPTQLEAEAAGKAAAVIAAATMTPESFAQSIPPVVSRALVPVVAPPKPRCEIEIPTQAKLRRVFTAKIRAIGPATVAWLHGSQMTREPFAIPNNGVENMLKPGPDGKLGRIVGERRLLARPNQLKVSFLKASMNMKVVGGVEGVEGAASRSECHKTLKVKLPLWAKIGAVLMTAAAVPGPYVCYAPGTLIRLVDGSEAPIESLRPGQRLWASPGRPAPVVAELITRPYRGAMHRISTSSGSVTVTPEHAMITDTGVKAAADLDAFDALIAPDGTEEREVRVERASNSGDYVYNLRLETTSDEVADHLVVAGGVLSGDLYLQASVARSQSLAQGLAAAESDLDLELEVTP